MSTQRPTTKINADTLRAAVRVGDSDAEKAEITRLLALACEVVDKHAPDAPQVVKNEAIIRVCGYLFDSPTSWQGQGFSAVLKNSSAAALLLPYRQHRAGKVGGATEAAETPETPAGVMELINEAIAAFRALLPTWLFGTERIPEEKLPLDTPDRALKNLASIDALQRLTRDIHNSSAPPTYSTADSVAVAGVALATSLNAPGGHSYATSLAGPWPDATVFLILRIGTADVAETRVVWQSVEAEGGQKITIPASHARRIHVDETYEYLVVPVEGAESYPIGDAVASITVEVGEETGKTSYTGEIDFPEPRIPDVRPSKKIVEHAVHMDASHTGLVVSIGNVDGSPLPISDFPDGRIFFRIIENGVRHTGVFQRSEFLAMGSVNLNQAGADVKGITLSNTTSILDRARIHKLGGNILGISIGAARGATTAHVTVLSEFAWPDYFTPAPDDGGDDGGGGGPTYTEIYSQTFTETTSSITIQPETEAGAFVDALLAGTYDAVVFEHHVGDHQFSYCRIPLHFQTFVKDIFYFMSTPFVIQGADGKLVFRFRKKKPEEQFTKTIWQVQVTGSSFLSGETLRIYGETF